LVLNDPIRHERHQLLSRYLRCWPKSHAWLGQKIRCDPSDAVIAMIDPRSSAWRKRRVAVPVLDVATLGLPMGWSLELPPFTPNWLSPFGASFSANGSPQMPVQELAALSLL
jgi:hypothetical protein